MKDGLPKDSGGQNFNARISRRRFLEIAGLTALTIGAACAPQPGTTPPNPDQPKPTESPPTPASKPTLAPVQLPPNPTGVPASVAEPTLEGATIKPDTGPAAKPIVSPTNPPAVKPTEAPQAITCDHTTSSEKQKAGQEFDKRYAPWRSGFITTDGANTGLRVKLPEGKGSKKDETVSEGIGYGMLFSCLANDKATFDKLWSYAKSYSKSNGLTPWEIDASGKVMNTTSATDGDEDIAFALLMADKKWEKYGTDAKAMIKAIMDNQVEAATFVLKPGDTWGGTATVNPSYFSPAYYKVFAKYTGDNRWISVADKCYAIINNINQKNAASSNGLLPNWAAASGDHAPDNNLSYHYEWDAARVPLRLLMDALMFCDTRAITQLNKINDFIKRFGPGNIKEGFTLDGKPLGAKMYAVFLAPLVAASMISTDISYRDKMWNLLSNLRDLPDYYYDPAIRLFSLAIMSGKINASSV